MQPRVCASMNQETESLLNVRSNLLKTPPRRGRHKKVTLIIVASSFCTAVVIGFVSFYPYLLLVSSESDSDKIVEAYSPTILVSGHNDIAMQYRRNAENKVYSVDLRKDMRPLWKDSHTDIPRLQQGKIGAQFWSAFVSCDSHYKDAVHLTLDQIDVIKKLVGRYPDVFEFVTTSQGILDAFSRHRIGSLIGVEGGHSMDSSLGILRMLYDVGARYMTLTHDCSTPWADSWTVDKQDYVGKKLGGLTDFGQIVVKEMNRLGMLVDLSHVAKQTMIDAIQVSRAPVIFSHSSAFGVCNHYRNVQDDVLLNVKDNGGVVMVNFYNLHINCNPNLQENATLGQVADHIEYIKALIGVDHVGIGGDYDGVPTMPQGLEDVSKFPALIEELYKRGWTDEQLKKVVGDNLLRVFRAVEKVKETLRNEPPFEDLIPKNEIPHLECRTDF